MKKYFILILLFIPCCATVPAITQIDKIIESGTVDEQTKKVLIEAKKEIIKSEQKAEDNKAWATRGKTGAVIFAGIFVLFFLGIVIKFIS